MNPKIAKAIQEIDAAVFNGDTFEEPEACTELIEYIERWRTQLARPFHGTKPPVFEEEWAKKEAAGYQYGHDALEQVRFGFEIANEAHARGYQEPEEPGAVFSLEEVKATFWKTFHKSGERWFCYIREEAECEESTAMEWDDFLRNLPNAKESRDGR